MTRLQLKYKNVPGIIHGCPDNAHLFHIDSKKLIGTRKNDHKKILRNKNNTHHGLSNMGSGNNFHGKKAPKSNWGGIKS